MCNYFEFQTNGKDGVFSALVAMLFSGGPYEEHLCEIIFEFGPVVQEDM